MSDRVVFGKVKTVGKFHNWTFKHDILGDGTVTFCPIRCPKFPEWWKEKVNETVRNDG